MERTKRMLVVMLTSFGIFALLTFLTFSSYGQTAPQNIKGQAVQSQNFINHSITSLEKNTIQDFDIVLQK